MPVPYITEAGATGDIRSQAGAWERDNKNLIHKILKK